MIHKIKEGARPYVTQLVHSPWWVKVIAVLILIYIFGPIDLVPDFLPIIGWVDDVAAAILLIKLIMKYSTHPDPGELLTKARWLINKLPPRLAEFFHRFIA